MRAPGLLGERDERCAAVDHAELGVDPVRRHRASLREQSVYDRVTYGAPFVSTDQRLAVGFETVSGEPSGALTVEIAHPAGVVLDHVIARCPNRHHQIERRTAARRHARLDAGKVLLGVDDAERVMDRLERGRLILRTRRPDRGQESERQPQRPHRRRSRHVIVCAAPRALSLLPRNHERRRGWPWGSAAARLRSCGSPRQSRRAGLRARQGLVQRVGVGQERQPEGEHLLAVAGLPPVGSVGERLQLGALT